MSPLGDLIERLVAPLPLVLLLFCEWWLLWFTLGRPFRATTALTLIANACSVGGLALLAASGAIGSSGEERAATAAVVDAGWVAWFVALAAQLAASVGIEAVVLRALMRRWRRSWDWNGYDLLAFTAAHLALLGAAALLL